MANNKGVLVLFSGPSGVGKDTVLEIVLNKDTSLQKSVSCTTRSIRENEIEGKVEKQMEDNQKDYYLREKISVISEELGEGEDSLSEIERHEIYLKYEHETDARKAAAEFMKTITDDDRLWVKKLLCLGIRQEYANVLKNKRY